MMLGGVGWGGAGGASPPGSPGSTRHRTGPLILFKSEGLISSDGDLRMIHGQTNRLLSKAAFGSLGENKIIRPN